MKDVDFRCRFSICSKMCLLQAGLGPQVTRDPAGPGSCGNLNLCILISAVSAVSVLGQDGRALEKDQKTQLPSLDDANDFKTVKLHQVASDPSTFIPTFIKFPIQVPTQMIQKSEDELMSVAQVTTVDFPSRGNNHCTKVETCCALDGCLWLLSVVFPSNMV